MLAGAGFLRPGACGQDGGMPRPAPRHDRDAGGPAEVLAAKAALRQEVWLAMRAARVARFPGAAGRIPNFTGAEAAAERLRGTAMWQAARTGKAKPDPAQLPVRQRALEEGETVYLAGARLGGPGAVVSRGADYPDEPAPQAAADDRHPLGRSDGGEDRGDTAAFGAAIPAGVTAARNGRPGRGQRGAERPARKRRAQSVSADGNPKRGRVLLSNRVIAEIRLPAMVSTIRPTVTNSPVSGSRA